MNDNRDKNIEFNISSPSEFTQEYFKSMSEVQQNIDLSDLPEIIFPSSPTLFILKIGP